VLLGDVTGIDVGGRRVLLADGALAFDVLVLATGATHAYFGHDEWAAHAPGLKSIEDALEIRRRVLLAFEAAERTSDPAARAALLTFVVVGGGPTGVELAGALSEIARHALTKDFRTIDPRDARVVLVEGMPRLLGAFPDDLSRQAQRQLEALEVTVRVSSKVTAIDAEGVELDGERIRARTVLWAAGVAASPLGAALRVPLDGVGRVLVEPDLSIPGDRDVFVIGDLAAHRQEGRVVTGVAPVAIQQGGHVARTIQGDLAGVPRRPFHYVDKGSLATIGRAAAVADLGRLHLTGFAAWLAWLFVHVFFLIGFRNRVLVIFSWAWTYLTYERGARLITGEPRVAASRATTSGRVAVSE
jgi:NADH dehydrogenase